MIKKGLKVKILSGKDKAKEILITIIKTGSPDDAHEARILNLQIS